MVNIRLRYFRQDLYILYQDDKELLSFYLKDISVVESVGGVSLIGLGQVNSLDLTFALSLFGQVDAKTIEKAFANKLDLVGVVDSTSITLKS